MIKYIIESGSTKQVDKLKELGIESTVKYVHSDVPCECRTEITTHPKNELELYACIGIFYNR
jgi:hypothetical protein